MLRSIVVAAALMPAIAVAAAASTDVPWSKVGEATLPLIEQERAARNIPSIMIGVVSRDGLMWSGGAGHADAEGKVAVDADTIYRIGGLTQLFTAELLRAFAARDAVDLDAPVQRYLTSFQPRNPFGGEITLRHLLEHRSGVVREPPKGNHFDVEAVTLEETVMSLNATALVAKPGASYKYSDAGYAVIGRVLEVVGGKSLEDMLQETVLKPKAMTRTTLRADKKSLAHSLVAPFDGERFTAAVFDMGIAPSVGASSSLNDLARFTQSLVTRDTSSLDSEFARSTLDGHDVVSFTGTMYGYVSDVALFPADGFAVITLIAIDGAQPAMRRLREFTARQVFATAKKQRKPAMAISSSIPIGTAHRLEGHYSDGARSLDIRMVDQRLFLEAPDVAGELRQRGGRIVIDDLAVYRDDIQIDTKARTISVGGVTYTRTPWQRPATSEEIEGLVGEYGWQHNIVRIYERDGEPYARVEWSQHQKLEPVAKDAYRFPAVGSYANEELRFVRDARGFAMAASLSGFALPRRDFGAEVEARSRSNARFVPELLAGARKMSPPTQRGRLRKPDLVEVNKVEPGTKLDVRYATVENFMGYAFYESPRFFLQRPAANGLIRAHRKLAEHGFGIVLIDGYRPWYVTRMFWDSVPPESRAFVADPSQGSRHNRGCAADITMFELATGAPVEMPGRYDEVSSRSSPLYLGGTSLQRWRRDLLKRAVEAEGFDVYSNEWWHFDYGEWRQYPIMNVEFTEITTAEPR